MFGEYFTRRRIQRESQQQRFYSTLPVSWLPTKTCCMVGEETFPVNYIKNIKYYKEGTERHHLDIYYSPSAIQHHLHCVESVYTSVPVLLFVHGGGWHRGDRGEEWRGGPNVGRAAARHGIISVVPSYQLAPFGLTEGVLWLAITTLLLTRLQSKWIREDVFLRWLQVSIFLLILFFLYVYFDDSRVRHPESVLDIARVISWARNHLKDVIPKADVDRIVLAGHSAGGHLVSLVATDSQYLRKIDPQLEKDSKVFLKGVCSISGIYNLDSPVNDNPDHIRNSLFRLSYGKGAFGSDRNKLKDASPSTHLHSSVPPFLLLSASSDLGLDVDARNFYKLLKLFGVESEWFIMPNKTHTSIANTFERNEAHRHLIRFIHKYCYTRRNIKRMYDHGNF